MSTTSSNTERMSAKAISVNAYWAWAIREGHKTVENRTWRTKHRGPLLIHASISDEHDAAAIRFLKTQLAVVLPHQEINALRGCLVARCNVTSCDDHAPLILNQANREEGIAPAWQIK